MMKLVVLFCAVAMAAAKPGVGVVPLAYSAGVFPALSSQSQYSSSVLHGYSPLVYSAGYGAPVYAPGLLAQPPHSPALVLDPVNGVPLDTPEVVAARVAHYQAKALSGLPVHHLKKRSLVAPLAYSSVAPLAYSSPYVSTYSAPLLSAYSSPYVSAYSSPVVASSLAYHGVVPKAYSVHPW